MYVGLGVIRWGIDPRIVSFGALEIRYYGLMWCLGLILGYILMQRFARKEGFPPLLVDSLALWGALAGIVGARLGHCLFYDYAYYSAHPGRIFAIWEGGLASHGGAIGVMIMVLLLVRYYKLDALWVFDRLVIPVALLAVLIRLGNFFNSEIYGIPTTLPWGTIFIRNGEVEPKHPTQLYEALIYLGVFFSLWALYAKRENLRKGRGWLFSLFLLGVFVSRFLLEFIKEDQSAFEANMRLNMGQWLSVPFILLGLVLLMYAWRKGSQPEPNFERFEQAMEGDKAKKSNRAQRRREARKKR